jgi:hypothetical protein
LGGASALTGHRRYLAATGVPADAPQYPTAAGDPTVRRTRERLRRLEGRQRHPEAGPRSVAPGVDVLARGRASAQAGVLHFKDSENR